MNTSLTGAGRNVLLRCLTGDAELHFSKVQFGKGASQDASTATALIDPVIAVAFDSISAGSSYVTLTASFENTTITEGFHITEVGFWVLDPDDAETEILYALGIEAEATADYVPPNTSRTFEYSFAEVMYISDIEDVSATIAASATYATVEQLQATNTAISTHANNTNNPHQVTKSQVGLGNVPNVTTNNQTPTFGTATALTEPVSGETVSVLWGKVKKAVNTLISHLTNKDNPHEVKGDQLSGKVPITLGGTGATTAKNARNNIGIYKISHTSTRVGPFSVTAGNAKLFALNVSNSTSQVIGIVGCKVESSQTNAKAIHINQAYFEYTSTAQYIGFIVDNQSGVNADDIYVTITYLTEEK